MYLTSILISKNRSIFKRTLCTLVYMEITTSKKVMIRGEELIAFHLSGKDLHLTYGWKGGERRGAYRILQATRCMEVGLCDLDPYPRNWRISKQEKPIINQLLGKPVFIVSTRN